MSSENSSLPKARKIVLWNADGVGEGRSSIQVLLDWLATPGNYARWKSSNLTIKNDAAHEITKILNEEGIMHRNIGHIYNKIGDLERSYVKSRAKVNILEASKNTSGVESEETAKLLSRHCKHYLVLDPIMREFLANDVIEAMKEVNSDTAHKGDSSINFETTYTPNNHDIDNETVLDNDISLPYIFPSLTTEPERQPHAISTDLSASLSTHLSELLAVARKYQEERLVLEKKRLQIEEERLEFDRAIFKRTCLQKDLDIERSRFEIEKMRLELAISQARAPHIIGSQVELGQSIGDATFPLSYSHVEGNSDISLNDGDFLNLSTSVQGKHLRDEVEKEIKLRYKKE